MPVGPLASIIFSGSGDQLFQSPTTDTSEALGAHTAKRTPCESAVCIDDEPLRAEQLPQPPVGSLAEQVQVELTDRPSNG